MEFEHSKEETMYILDIMNKVGYSQLTIEYSGGNDSGGFDSAEAQFPDGRTEAVTTHNDRSYEFWEGAFDLIPLPIRKNDELKNELLYKCLEPVYNYYGSFAGEYTTHGTISVVPSHTESPIEIEDNYSEYEYDEEYDDDEYETEEVEIEQPKQ